MNVITHHDPHFLKTVYANPAIKLHNTTQFLKKGSRYIVYTPTKKVWSVYKHAEPRRLCGRFNNLIDAGYCVSKGE